jgi:hypothetical protein
MGWGSLWTRGCGSLGGSVGISGICSHLDAGCGNLGGYPGFYFWPLFLFLFFLVVEPLLRGLTAESLEFSSLAATAVGTGCTHGTGLFAD